jgi:hypothetical protein
VRLVVTLVWLSSVVATAQTVVPRPPVPQRQERVQQVQQVTFGGTDVTGCIVKGDTGFELLKPKIIFKNLIQLRGSFARELHDSVDAL